VVASVLIKHETSNSTQLLFPGIHPALLIVYTMLR